MWKLLVPLLILLVVALIGVNTYENYVSYSGNLYDSSGNIVGNIGENRVDPSGNILDSSGNVLGNLSQTGANTAGTAKSGLITLSLTDLIALIGKSSMSSGTTTTVKSTTGSTGATTGATTGSTGSTGATGTTGTTTGSAGVTTTTNNVIDMYNQIKPSLISDISNAVRTGITGAPYTPAAPMRGGGVCSDSSAQGAELQSAQSTMIDSNDYIRKDSIPCYGCSLPQ
jgi:hypothetical protein